MSDIRAAIEEFRKVQRRVAKFGAEDTEPDWHFCNIVRRAYQRKDVDFSSLDWELYSNMSGAKKAASELTAAAKKVHKCVLENAKTSDLDYLQGECDRVDFEH